MSSLDLLGIARSGLQNPLICSSLAACVLSLAACTSTSDVAATDKPNVFTVTASTRGARLSWVSAYRKAVSSASGYCTKRGMQVGTRLDFIRSGRELEQQGTELTFECHPPF
ncbi:hypothetical protein AB4Y40_15195 [Paraburkholderia sp. EG287B]|uniref:hypothetical protein n=1 Tax=Paraburkholderia sp. EG287B TaxID=3237010 RepID=UPI0034D341F1